MSPKHALSNGMDVPHIPVGVVPAEDSESDHQHVDHMVGEHGVAGAFEKVQQLPQHLWRSAGESSAKHSRMRRPSDC